MHRLIGELKAATPAPGVDEVLLPGERAWRATQKHRAEGIPLDEGTVHALDAVAKEAGTALEWE